VWQVQTGKRVELLWCCGVVAQDTIGIYPPGDTRNGWDESDDIGKPMHRSEELAMGVTSFVQANQHVFA
jgi:hypothetical protein